MDPTASIRRLGFRKWYERELIKCHGALVTCLLCGILVAALVESLSTPGASTGLLLPGGVMFAAIVLGWISWRAYIKILQRAELYGERSSCPQCKAYGRFEVLDSGMDSVPGRTAEAVAPLAAAWMRVRCRKCSATWRMPE